MRPTLNIVFGLNLVLEYFQNNFYFFIIVDVYIK